MKADGEGLSVWRAGGGGGGRAAGGMAPSGASPMAWLSSLYPALQCHTPEEGSPSYPRLVKGWLPGGSPKADCAHMQHTSHLALK